MITETNAEYATMNSVTDAAVCLPQWAWVMDRQGEWHALHYVSPTTYENVMAWMDEYGEPAKGSHRFVECGKRPGQSVSFRLVQVHDFSRTNPLPQKCCHACLERVVTRRVLQRMGVK